MMGAFIAKQPNGLYCRFSTVVDCPTDWNMTEDDYINLCVERAKETAEHDARNTLKNHVRNFEVVKERFTPGNMTRREYKIFLDAVGDGGK